MRSELRHGHYELKLSYSMGAFRLTMILSFSKYNQDSGKPVRGRSSS